MHAMLRGGQPAGPFIGWGSQVVAHLCLYGGSASGSNTQHLNFDSRVIQRICIVYVCTLESLTNIYLYAKTLSISNLSQWRIVKA